MDLYLGIDIGGTAVKLGLIDSQARLLARHEASVSFDAYKTPISLTVQTAARAFLQQEQLAPEALCGIGVAATGQIDSLLGVVAGTCGNLPDWEQTPLKQELEACFGRPVTVANDANCMCLGEGWVGRAVGCPNYLGLTIGTGIGGGIVSGGRLIEGARGLGGETGHIRTHAITGRLCTCGGRGCWEQYASATALVKQAQALDKSLRNARQVFAAAPANPALDHLLDDWITEIAAGIVGLVHIFNPELILIGGGVSQQTERLILPLARQVQAAVMPAFARGLRLEAASLRNDAGMIGAVRYFIQRQLTS
ncbi:MAG: ROK family protein [Oscillospiraceae bacterium]|nr:ROK family protein [Oscillospiraceae bacterium]MDD4368451.1 ROK family protein [Oscillospiraceae bacterium]